MSESKPSQAGKFKPRKPPKKKKAAALIQSTSSEVSNDNAVASSESVTQKSAPRRGQRDGMSSHSSDRGRGRGRGGRGRGRGGRGDVPKGTVFFTGDAALANAVKVGAIRKDTGATANSTVTQVNRAGETSGGYSRILRAGLREKHANEVEEIIVGEIEGFDDPNNKKSILSNKTEEEYNRPSRFDKSKDDEMNEVDMDGLTYDSDSSDDEARNYSSTRDHLCPHELPVELPTSSLGPQSVLPMYKCQLSNDINEDSFAKVKITEDSDSPLRHPFLTQEASSENKLREKKSWMLFKFPTRIPPVQKVSTVAMDSNTNHQDIKDETENSSGGQHVSSSTFDDVFKHTPPGSYGKIVMYKSGKTFFVIGEDDNQVRMEITEGIQCGFYQQAVSIKAREAKYIPVGEVTRSLVISPDIDGALQH